MPTTLGIKDKSTTGSRSVGQSLGTSHKTFQDVYYVVADDKSQNEDDVMSAPGIPDYRSLSNGAYLVRKSAKEVSASALLWEVTCFYNSQMDGSAGGGTGPGKAQVWSWSSEEIEQVILTDQLTGATIQNSAFEPFLDIISKVVIPVLTIRRIENSFDPNIMITYGNTTNLTTFWGAPPGTALMMAPTDEPYDEDGVEKRQVTYKIKFNFTLYPGTVPADANYVGWSTVVLDEGTKYFTIADDPTSQVPATEKGIPVTVNLQSNGTQLPKGAAVNWKIFDTYRRSEFNNLSLGPW